jgi:hypothetical protein
VISYFPSDLRGGIGCIFVVGIGISPEISASKELPGIEKENPDSMGRLDNSLIERGTSISDILPISSTEVPPDGLEGPPTDS